MTKKISKEDYLQCRDRTGRIAILDQLAEHGPGIPISLAEDLLSLDISHLEKMALVRATASSSTLKLEDFYSRHIVGFHQDVAVQSLRSWAQNCEGLLWYRLLKILAHASISNRVRYTILDIAPKIGGKSVVELCLKDPSIEGQSPAYHALLLQRALQFCIQHDHALNLAKLIVQQSKNELHPQNKALMAAVIYLDVYDKMELVNGKFEEANVDAFLREFAFLCIQKKQEPHKTKGKKDSQRTKLSHYFSFAERLQFTVEQTLEYVQASNLDDFTIQDFSGIKQDVLEGCLESMDVSDEDLMRLIKLFSPWIRAPFSNRFVEIVRDKVSKAKNLTKVMQDFPGDLNLLLSSNATKQVSNSSYAFVFNEQEEIISQNKALLSAKDTSLQNADVGELFRTIEFPFSEKPELCENISDTKSRRRFLRSFLSKDSKHEAKFPQDMHSYWSLLEMALGTVDIRLLEKLSTEARKQPAVYQWMYLMCLGVFVGFDEASLKVLDFIRSEHEDELRFAFKSLRKINTSRALQELVHALGRPNVGIRLQSEIASLLVGADLHKLQNELRIAVNDLKLQPDRNSERWDLFETLESFLIPGDITKVDDHGTKKSLDSNQGMLPTTEDGFDTDSKLKNKIPGVDKLSSEARRALRTAMYFYEVTKSKTDAKNNIDLSPVVDMQYKALELSFRETFEQSVTDVLNRSQISHKLDAIGYARPIPAKMDEFENYLASLPIIREIPFFSKFKLRKLLRSICQFQPGRRFTLDGLKAFALFFLCFSRDRCEYGLQNSFNIGLSNNEELFYFVSQLHILQDMRNRAAHEGFQPDARNDIEAIWKTTANLVEILLRIRALKSEVNAPAKPLGLAG